MQGDNSIDAGAASNTSHSKVAIPRLTRPDRLPPTKAKRRSVNRVGRACQNCHNRKVKCNGGVPRCDLCERADLDCVYEPSQKHRLATAHERLVALLRDLSSRVDERDRKKIEDALQRDDDSAASMPSTSSTSTTQLQPTTEEISQHILTHQQLDEDTDQSHSHLTHLSNYYLHTTAETAPTSNTSSQWKSDTISRELQLPETSVTYGFEAREQYFIGPASEIRWLQSLVARVKQMKTVIVGPVDLPSRSQSPFLPAPSENLTLTNYFLVNDNYELTAVQDPYQLPPEFIAKMLFQRYISTVHATFPVIPMDLENLVFKQYSLLEDRQPAPEMKKWYAITNLVFAIGARLSELVVDGNGDDEEVDHIIYVSNAFRLLRLNDATIILSAPDLSMVQALSLLAFYYMIVGYVDRAWGMAGIALRFASLLGLHAQDPNEPNSSSSQQDMVRTWWGLHSLESLLSSITGRPNMISNEEIITPPPSAIVEDQQHAPQTTAINLSFLNSNISIGLSTQQVISHLYTPRKAPRSWKQTQETIKLLLGNLEVWADKAMLQNRRMTPYQEVGQQREAALSKFQYYRTKILITRPCLGRVEQFCAGERTELTDFDRSNAEECIRTAQSVASLLPTNFEPQVGYEYSPWWSIVHNIMQAITILMIGISCAEHFSDSLNNTILCTKQLVGWLKKMRQTNNVASRAYFVLNNIVKTTDPRVWAPIAEAFPDEVPLLLEQEMADPDDAQDVPWVGQDPSFGLDLTFDMDEYGGYQFPPAQE